jgi:aspartyl-tRNA(Asn)/glutamyl-tRNA(Gln) amidotransferase subunit A
MTDLDKLSASELVARLGRRDLSAEEVVRFYLRRIAERDGDLRSYLWVDDEGAVARARDVDRRRAAGEPVGELAGVPIAIKDNISTAGRPTTCASRILADFRPPFSAHVIELLERADAIVLGKTNMDEFAMGSSTENSGLGPTRNPWDADRAPGGSSGGSAAAVAAGLAPWALGSDTGGSVRQPASFCGVVGLKPTYGRVSRWGLVAFASSLDQIGPITHTAADAALLLRVIAQPDKRDSTCTQEPVPDYVAELEKPVRGLRLGLPREYFGAGLEPAVEQAVRAALQAFESLGVEVVEVSLPHTEYAVATYYIVATAEASSNLARYDGAHYGYRSARPVGDIVDLYSYTRAEGFGDEVKRRIMLGTYALSSGYYDAYYLKGQKVRALIKQDFDRAFAQVDAVACPTSPTVPFRLGERTADPLSMYLSDVYTISANLAGIPGISIPCGLVDGKLPVGLQLLAPAFAEGLLLRLSAAYERASGFGALSPG